MTQETTTPITSKDLSRLVASIDVFVTSQQATSDRLTRMEASQESLEKAVIKMVESQEKTNENINKMSNATIKMEGEISRIEEKSLAHMGQLTKRVDKMDDSIQKKFDSVDEEVGKLTGRIYIMEIENTTNVAIKQTEDKLRGWLADNWFNLFKALGMLMVLGGGAILVYEYVVKNIGIGS